MQKFNATDQTNRTRPFIHENPKSQSIFPWFNNNKIVGAICRLLSAFSVQKPKQFFLIDSTLWNERVVIVSRFSPTKKKKTGDEARVTAWLENRPQFEDLRPRYCRYPSFRFARLFSRLSLSVAPGPGRLRGLESSLDDVLLEGFW